MSLAFFGLTVCRNPRRFSTGRARRAPSACCRPPARPRPTRPPARHFSGRPVRTQHVDRTPLTPRPRPRLAHAAPTTLEASRNFFLLKLRAAAALSHPAAATTNIFYHTVRSPHARPRPDNYRPPPHAPYKPYRLRKKQRACARPRRTQAALPHHAHTQKNCIFFGVCNRRITFCDSLLFHTI